MSKKARVTGAYLGIGLAVAYFLVVISYFLVQSTFLFKCWEAMIMLSAPILLIVLLTILDDVEESKRAWKIAAIVFMTCTTVVTSMAHYSSIISDNTVAQFQTNDSLAWGFFMGLAFIFSSFALSPKAAGWRRVKQTLLICGCLCLLGLAGPLLHIDALWFVAVAGYGIGTPIVCVQLLSVYKKQNIS